MPSVSLDSPEAFQYHIEMVRILAVFLFVALGSSFARAQGHVVGNGGEGIFHGNRLVLRDLWEAGLQDHAVFGPERDPVIESRLEFFPLPLAFSKEKLARKLTDLNRASPGFGDFLLQALTMYTWSSTDQHLDLLPDEGTTVHLPGPRVQIANRLGATIRVHRPSWIMLSDEDRVALLIHEAVYSLLLPRTDTDGTYFQSSIKAREIVGALFSDDFLVRGPVIVDRLIAPELDVPWKNVPPTTPENLLWNLDVVLKADTLHSVLSVSMSKLGGLQTNLGLIDALCEKARSLSATTSGPLEILSQELLPKCEGTFIPYSSRFGIQNWLHLSVRSEPLLRVRSVIDVVTPGVCEWELRSFLSDVMGEI